MTFFLFKKRSAEDRILTTKLKDILGFKPSNIEIYKNSLRHSSAGYNDSGKRYNNERLEFIGDAIISAVVSDILYKEFPRADEGKLSILRSTIVNRNSLNKVAQELKIGELMTFKLSNTSSMKNMGGNSLEALIGAIYYDKGYKYCQKFLLKIITANFELTELLKQNTDHKSRLLQIMQKHKLNICINTHENCEDNEKIQHFLCEICFDEMFIAEGKGWSKKEAEQNAAQKALQVLKAKKYSLHT